MKILITGATGFIGGHLARRLARTNHELHCLVRGTSNIRLLKELGVTTVTGDVTDKGSLLEGMAGCDWVINLAGIYSYWEPNKNIYADVNVNGTRNVMESALETGVSKVMHLSTATVYGKPVECPFNEDSEMGPFRFSEYARTKYQGDLIAWALHEKMGLALVVLYPGAVLGPGDGKPTGQYIMDLAHCRLPAISLEDSVLTFVHVRDVADAIVKAAEKEGNVGRRYLVGKYQMSIGELNRIVSELSEAALPRLRLPESLAALNAALLTALAGLTKAPPAWGMSTDQVRTTREGYRFDGSKVERELDITYTPIQAALAEAVASCQAAVPGLEAGVRARRD